MALDSGKSLTRVLNPIETAIGCGKTAVVRKSTMKITEVVDSNQNPLTPPRFIVQVGDVTKSAVNPAVVLWPGITATVLNQVNVETVVVTKNADIRKVGTHLRFIGTFN